MSGTVPGTARSVRGGARTQASGAAGRACAQTNWPSQSGDQRGVAGVRLRCPVPEVPFAALPETPPPPHWLERVSWPYLLQPRGPDQRHCPPPAAARQSRLTPTSALIPCAPGYSAPESLPCASPPMLRPLAGWGGEIRRRGLARHPRYCDARRFSSVRRWTTFLEETEPLDDAFLLSAVSPTLAL